MLMLKKKNKNKEISGLVASVLPKALKGNTLYCNCVEGESAVVLFQVLSPALQLLILKW